MGLSSSQGRLLMLTARLSDIELAQIMISQRQNQLAWESEEAAKEYNQAVSNCKLTIKLPDGDTGKKVAQNLTYKNMFENGFVIVDAKGNVYLNKDDKGNWIYPENGSNFGVDSWSPSNSSQSYEPADASIYMQSPEVLQEAIMNGLLFVYNTNDESATEPMSLSVLQAETDIEYITDTSDDAKAQSKYEYETARIERKENALEMDMQQLETQHEAVSKEYDSVKEVISSNVERTFKLFSNG